MGNKKPISQKGSRILGSSPSLTLPKPIPVFPFCSAGSSLGSNCVSKVKKFKLGDLEPAGLLKKEKKKVTEKVPRD